MPPLTLWKVVLNGLFVTLPWAVAAAAVLGLVAWSPIGQAILRALRQRRRDSALIEDVLGELIGLRQTLGEVVERLDATERRLASSSSPPDSTKGPRTPPPELRDPDRIVTPV